MHWIVGLAPSRRLFPLPLLLLPAAGNKHQTGCSLQLLCSAAGHAVTHPVRTNENKPNRPTLCLSPSQGRRSSPNIHRFILAPL
jgi:hypothetical protein